MTTDAKETEIVAKVREHLAEARGDRHPREDSYIAFLSDMLDHIATLTRERDDSHAAHRYMEAALADVLTGGFVQTHENVLDIDQYTLVERVRILMIEHEEALAALTKDRDPMAQPPAQR